MRRNQGIWDSDAEDTLLTRTKTCFGPVVRTSSAAANRMQLALDPNHVKETTP
ncbi:hypothetical protein ACFL6C_02195 [Myxococcota bacterium]